MGNSVATSATTCPSPDRASAPMRSAMSACYTLVDPQPPIAIVGMAGRFPGAVDIDSFWRMLVARGDAIRPVPSGRWDASAPGADTVQPVGGFLDGIDEFDPTFFGISPREAADID